LFYTRASLALITIPVDRMHAIENSMVIMGMAVEAFLGSVVQGIMFLLSRKGIGKR
jgi:ABC-type Fe3+-siderophore transport system permease subunit